MHSIKAFAIVEFKGVNIPDKIKYNKPQGVSFEVIKEYIIDWAISYGLADTSQKTSVQLKQCFKPVL